MRSHMNPDADRRVRSALAEYICADPDVIFAVAFGSQRSDSVARSSNFDVGAVHEVLAHYHRNPEEMRRVGERHGRAAAEARRRSSVTPTK